MKYLSILIMAFVVSGTLVLAHEGNEHVRSVVTKVSPQAITLETTGKKTTPAAAQTAAKAAPAKKLDIAFTSSPKPTKTGDNAFEVIIKDAAGKPVTGADVSVLLFMPAMPAMKMAEMRNEVKLKHAGAGKYTGTGQVMMKGIWTVTVSVKENGAEVGQKKLTLTAN